MPTLQGRHKPRCFVGCSKSHLTYPRDAHALGYAALLPVIETPYLCRSALTSSELERCWAPGPGSGGFRTLRLSGQKSSSSCSRQDHLYRHQKWCQPSQDRFTPDPHPFLSQWIADSLFGDLTDFLTSINLLVLALFPSPLLHAPLGRAPWQQKRHRETQRHNCLLSLLECWLALVPSSETRSDQHWGRVPLSSAKRLAMISLDLRKAFCINPHCVTSALWIKRGFYFPELSIRYFSMLDKFTFSINKKNNKERRWRTTRRFSPEVSGCLSFLVRDKDIPLQLHSARPYGNLILILKWCFQMYVLLIEEFTLIYLS